MKQIIYILLCFVLTSCLNKQGAVSPSLEDKFKAEFPVADMNQSFRLAVDNDTNIFQNDSEIPIIFNNTSPYTISFQTDSFLKLLIIKDNKWSEIKNQYSYSGSLEIAPEGTMLLDTRRTTVQPEFDNNLTNAKTKHLVLMRILMVGETLDNGAHTGKFVGAYADVFLDLESTNQDRLSRTLVTKHRDTILLTTIHVLCQKLIV